MYLLSGDFISWVADSFTAVCFSLHLCDLVWSENLVTSWMDVWKTMYQIIHIVQHFKDHQFTLSCRLPPTHYKIQTCSHKYLFWLLSWFLPNWQLNSAHKAIRQCSGQMWCREERTCLPFFCLFFLQQLPGLLQRRGIIIK